MANDGQIVFEITADGKRAIADIKDVTKAIQQETSKWDDAAGKAADGMESKFSGMLKKLAAGFSAVKIGKALLDLGKDAIQAASDLQEVQNVVDVTFGENANQIEKWAKGAGEQFGLTETQAKKFSSTMGAMLKSAGLAGQQIVDVSTNLAGLAADMASFYNLDFEEAFSKIRSGMSGMTMPLKELGIDMSVDTMNAFALSQGLEKTYSEMTQGEQTMLRYQYLMSATADAQGDFARTSDSYANSVRKMQTNVEALKTTMGKAFLDVVADAVGALNGFLEMLLPDESKRTVLDDFADIDLKTDAKIESIRATAEEARLLTEELDKIGGEKADAAGSKVQQLVEDLNGINLSGDNASKLSGFLTTIANNIDVISGVTGESAEGVKEWMAEVGEAASNLSPEDADGWAKLMNSIKEGLPGIENTDFGKSFFESFGQGIEGVESTTSTFDWLIERLGNNTNKTAQEQQLWLETCKRLVQTIPGLSAIINTETGEVKGGTAAIKEYVKAWEEGQTKLAMLGALEQKETALSERFADLPGLELDYALAERRVKKSYDQLEGIYKKYGMKLQTDAKGFVVNDNFFGMGLTDEEVESIEKEINYYEQLVVEADDARQAYVKQKNACAEARQALKDMREMVDEMPDGANSAADAAGNLARELTTLEKAAEGDAEAITEISDAAQSALSAVQELREYYQKTFESVSTSVDSTVKGFEKIQTPMQLAAQKTKDLTAKLDGLGIRTTKNAEEWDKLNDEINQYNQQKISAQGMNANLQQQAQYMTEYLDLLNQAREKGISGELLAELSDGSVESYDYLAALAEAAPTEVAEINASYQTVIDKKKELTKELTDQKLSVDSTFQSMSEKAQEAVASLDLYAEAAANAGGISAGIAEGISSNAPAVAEAVDGIILELERLNGYGISIDFGGFGKIDFTVSTGGKAEGSGRMGLDFIPHDDYIARLHEGERVLTAQENQIWNTLLNGGVSGFDLESLGGVMRDNIKAGGNVYLDGREVGKVISDRQGKNYKSLQRSGWQS